MSPPSRFLLLLLSAALLSSPPPRCPALALAQNTVTHLPGFHGPLPFHMETGYVGVDDRDDVQLFYYFLPSEGDPAEDPLLLWLTGGPGCSAFSGLAFEIGPFAFLKVRYDGNLPTLVLNPYSWTKVANIIFLDSPVGTGFSFSGNPEGYSVGDMSSSKQVETFIRKWLVGHPHFVSNPFYVAGDSYAGKVVPVIAHLISEGMEAQHKPLVNLKGYLIGNAATEDRIVHFSRIRFVHGMGIISDELYELTMKYCEGQDYDYPKTLECANNLDVVKRFISEIDNHFILDPLCPSLSPRPKVITGDKRFLQEFPGENLPPPSVPDLECREYTHYLSYYWVNNDATREALHVKRGTVDEWQRCNYFLPYTTEMQSVILYHLNLTSKGYRALVYNGDLDVLVPFIGTQAWIRSLNFSIVDDWRSWSVDGQVAGYTRSYSNNLTFATVKGAGHTAPQYKPKECLAMFQRWISRRPL